MANATPSSTIRALSGLTVLLMGCQLGAQDVTLVNAVSRIAPSMSEESGAFPSLANPLLPLINQGSEDLIPGAIPWAEDTPSLPRVFAPSQPRSRYTRYPWRKNIVTTVFWIGEKPSGRNRTPNHVSSWDAKWAVNYGGYDDPSPEAREGYLPKDFTPALNPFYYALPYNDISRTGTKASARAVVPWFDEAFYRDGRTVLKGRWMAIRLGDKVCYAQWEDVGPFETDDTDYVFGTARPKTKENKCAGLDVSPAVRTFLGFTSGYATVDWRFVDVDEVPEGPWKTWGSNNPFANANFTQNAVPSDEVLDLEVIQQRLLAIAAENEASLTTTHQ